MVENISGKLPPQSIDAERSLLGSLLLDKNSITRVVDFLLPKDFYKQTHKEIYQAVVELFERSEPIDLLSVATKLKEKKLLDNVGGNAYLTELVNTVPTSTHIANYAKIIQRKRICVYIIRLAISFIRTICIGTTSL